MSQGITEVLLINCTISSGWGFLEDLRKGKQTNQADPDPA